jgi:hypothetical protein
MSLKHLVTTLSLVLSGYCMASDPPISIFNACVLDKKNIEIEYTTIEGNFEKSPLGMCDEFLNFTHLEHKIGVINCNDQFYFFNNGLFVDPQKAKSYSISPYIKPEARLSARALWVGMKWKTKDYLCIKSPLAEQGRAGAFYKYYILENFTEKKGIPNIYFYYGSL